MSTEQQHHGEVQGSHYEVPEAIYPIMTCKSCSGATVSFYCVAMGVCARCYYDKYQSPKEIKIKKVPDRRG